jgi:hypothetical protein
LGYQKVFEYEINSYLDYTSFIKELEVYNIKEGNAKEDKKIDLKYLIYETVEVNDYDYKCSYREIGNKTQVYECEETIIGKHTEQRGVWKDLSSMDMKIEKIIVSGWTDVRQGDYYEWVPNFAGVKVSEWATWSGNLSTNILSYYRLDETSGTNASDVLGLNNGTANNNYIFNTSRTGRINTGADFSKGNFLINGTTSIPYSNFTVSAWVNASSFATTTRTIYSQREVGDTNPLVQFRFETDKLGVEARSNTGSGYLNSYGTVALTANRLYHAVLVYNGTNFRVYVNGSLYHTTAVYTGGSWADVDTSATWIGAGYGGGSGGENWMTGMIDEIGVWGRALSPTEITLLYNSGNGCSYGNESCFTPPDAYPTIALDSPIDNYNSTGYTNVFTCIGTDDIKVQNISLYINGSLNQTNTSVYNNTLTSFTTSLQQGVYNWTCKVWDNATIPQSATASVRNINVSLGPPSIILISPINYYNSSNVTIPFNCTVEDDKLIVNVSLYINGSRNETNSSGLNASYLFTKSISDGFYNWTCGAYDNDGQSTTASYRNFSVDSILPTIFVSGGNGSLAYLNLANNHTLNYTITDTNIQTCLISYNYTNKTLPCTSGATNTTNFTILPNVYNATIFVNDTFGNQQQQVVTWDYRMIFANETYQSSIIEGVSTIYSINLDTNGSAITIAYFTYNGTTSYGTITDNGGNFYTISKMQNAQLVTANTNYSFSWIITQGDFGNVSVSSNNQTVTNLGIDNCSVNTKVLYNFTMKDEEEQTEINETGSNSLAKLNFQLYNYGTRTVIQELNLEFNQTNPFAICFNNSFGTEQFSADMQLKYQADGYEQEYYHIQNATVQNSSFTTFISLYDLNTSDSQVFKLKVRDSSYQSVSDAIVTIYRKYIDEGVYKVVEIPLTDAKGETLAHLVLNDAVYNFVITRYGEIIANYSNVLAICQNPTLYTCTIDFSQTIAGIDTSDFADNTDFNSTITYNETSRVISTVFQIPSGTPKWVTLNVTRQDALGSAVCTDYITSSSGTLSCIVPESFGNESISAKVYVDGDFISRGSVKLDQSSRGIYGGVLVLLSVIVFITIIGVGISSNPVITVIFIFGGAMVMFVLNLVANEGLIGEGATILWFLIICLLIIIKGVNRN